MPKTRGKMSFIQVVSVLVFHSSGWWLLPFLSLLLQEGQATTRDTLQAHYLSSSKNLDAGPFSSFVLSPFSQNYLQGGPESSLSYAPVSSTTNGSSRLDRARLLINEIPRLPVWNGDAANSDQRHIDLSQLFELMGEPRGSRGRELSELITRPKPKCNRRIRILNGVTRIRERGSLARFQCSHGFTLIGPTTIVCLRDQWSESPPICVKNGCRPIRRPQNAEVRQSIGGAVVAFYCLGETRLQGDPILFCDGIRWNGTEPACYTEPTITPTPEPESDESWPESVDTPSPFNSAVQNTDTPSWDTNFQFTPSSLEATTDHPELTSEPQFDSTTELVTGSSVDESTAAFENHVPEITPLPSLRHSSIEQRENNERTTESSSIYPMEIATEKRPDIPAPVTTEQPMILTPEMGQNVTTSINITAPPSIVPTVVPPSVSVSVAPKSPDQLEITTIASHIHPQTPPFHPPSTHMWNTTTERNVFGPVINVLNITTTSIPTTTSTPKQTTSRRRIKIITKRPRRPTTTKRPTRRLRRTTTTAKPVKTKIPIPTYPILRTTLPPPPPSPTPAQSFPTTPYAEFVPDNQHVDSPPAPVDYPIAIDKEFLPREQVEPIRPIIFPDMLNNDAFPGEHASRGGEIGHVSMIIGILLVVVGLTTFSAGVVLYCWRKNKGIARARPYDMDGRTLSAHDANDDFMWVDQRDSGL